jgi:DNA-binding ferritin-like protein
MKITIKLKDSKYDLDSYINKALNIISFTHIHHWNTDNANEHEVLGEYYEELQNLIDDVAEYYIKSTNKKISEKQNKPTNLCPVEAIIMFDEETKEALKNCSDEMPDVKQGILKILELNSKTLYRLKLK